MFLDTYRPFQKRERMNSSHLSFICWVSVKTDSRPVRVPACVNKQWSDKNRSVLPSERHFRRRNRHSCVWGERKKKKTHRHLKLLACLQPRAVPSLRMCCYLFARSLAWFLRASPQFLPLMGCGWLEFLRVVQCIKAWWGGLPCLARIIPLS